MTERPPALPTRLLARALGPVEAAGTVLGDVEEDFSRRLREQGRGAAHRWYWKEALTLAAEAWFGRIVGRPVVRDDTREDAGMRDALSTSGFVQDVGYAIKALRRDRAFFVFATLIIGLGIGASTAVFSVMSPLLIQPLPFEDPGRLVLVENGDGTGGLSGVTSRTSNVRDFRTEVRSFEALGGFNAFFDQSSYNLAGGGEPERLQGVEVTSNLLDILGIQMAAGRNFTEREGLQDAEDTMILTHGFWVRRFGGDPSVVGRSLSLNDQPFTVVGVLPPDFDFVSVFTPTSSVDFLRPWPISDDTDNWGNTTTMVARLAPGVTMPAAQDELESVIAALEQADPERWGLGGRISGLQERIARPFRSGMLLLAAAAALVMLIVCVNMSNMLLARSPRRRREIAVRRTLGATRGRLVRQLLMESVFVSLSGAFVGLLIARYATAYVAGSTGLEIPMLSSITIDGTALGFTVAIALTAGLAVGAVPALQVSEGGESEALGGSTRGGGGSRGARKLRELLVITEVAMACVLLVFGGLVVRSFQEVMEVDLGFEPEHAIGWQLASSRDFDTLPAINAFFDEIAANVQAVPGVEAVGMVDALPLGTNRTWGTRVIDKEYPEEGGGDFFFPHIVDERYLQAMGIPLVEGRYFTAMDTEDAPNVIIVNEAAQRLLFEGDAIGKRIINFGGAQVIGVVGDVKHRALELGSDPEVYFPMKQLWAFQTVEMVVRTQLPPESVVAAVGAAVRQSEAQMPTEDWRTLESLVETSVSPRRFTLQILVAFALSALLLASLGIYGVLSYSVSERIPEIGIRMALGESAEAVRRSIVMQTMALAGIGVLVGAVVAAMGGRLASSLLFGVEPTDPVTFGATIVVLLVVCVISGLIPAIRASRVDSAGALRSAT